jgi:hypothetical protein
MYQSIGEAKAIYSHTGLGGRRQSGLSQDHIQVANNRDRHPSSGTA